MHETPTPERDPNCVLEESIQKAVEAAKSAIEVGKGTRFGLELQQLADEVLHRDDKKHGIRRTGTNRFEETE